MHFVIFAVPIHPIITTDFTANATALKWFNHLYYF